MAQAVQTKDEFKLAAPGEPLPYFKGLPLRSVRRMTEVETRRLKRSLATIKVVLFLLINSYLALCLQSLLSVSPHLMSFVVALPFLCLLLLRYDERVMKPMEAALHSREVQIFAHELNPSFGEGEIYSVAGGTIPLNKSRKLWRVLTGPTPATKQVAPRGADLYLTPEEKDEILRAHEPPDHVKVLGLAVFWVAWYAFWWWLWSEHFNSARDLKMVIWLMVYVTYRFYFNPMDSYLPSRKRLRSDLEDGGLYLDAANGANLNLASGNAWITDGRPATWRTTDGGHSSY